MSVAPSRASATIESQVRVERPNSNGRRAEQGDEDEHDAAGMVAQRMAGEPYRDRDRADARRGPQQAEAPGPEIENVARIDGQQRHGAGQQNREEVERDGAEHDLLAPDVAETGEDGVEADLFAALRPGSCGAA